MSENPNYRGDGDLTQYGPAMPAAVYMAFSEDVTPTGKLPVDIPSIDANYKFTDDILYERGYGLEYSGAAKTFRYQHDPRLNLKAMEDIIIDPSAVYGFSPSPTGSLAAYEGNPDGLETVKAHNLEKYGHEDGPTADEMFEKYGSWEQVIEKAFSHNPGMEACVGLYDDNYKYYIAFDYIEDESTAAASREYTVAAFIDAVGSLGLSDTNVLLAFSDAEDVSEIYAEELAQAAKYGLIKGYEDSSLRPKATIRRVEALTILSRMLSGAEPVREAVIFTDVPVWAKDAIENLSAAGIVEGYGNGMLGAYDDLTVEQIAILTARLNEYR